jgi:hypothetical protein
VLGRNLDVVLQFTLSSHNVITLQKVLASVFSTKICDIFTSFKVSLLTLTKGSFSTLFGFGNNSWLHSFVDGSGVWSLTALSERISGSTSLTVGAVWMRSYA